MLVRTQSILEFAHDSGFGLLNLIDERAAGSKVSHFGAWFGSMSEFRELIHRAVWIR
jgi:hypothetical protein